MYPIEICDIMDIQYKFRFVGMNSLLAIILLMQKSTTKITSPPPGNNIAHVHKKHLQNVRYVVLRIINIAITLLPQPMLNKHFLVYRE